MKDRGGGFVCALAVLAIVFFGVYGSGYDVGQFIYFQFQGEICDEENHLYTIKIRFRDYLCSPNNTMFELYFD